MYRYKPVHALFLVLGLFAAVFLGACRPAQQTDGSPLTPETPGKDVTEGQVYINSVDVMILESFPVQVRAHIQGNLPDGCTELRATNVSYDEDSKTFFVRFETYRDPEAMCTMALVPFEETVELDVYGLPAGEYTVDVLSTRASFELAVDNVLPEE